MPTAIIVDDSRVMRAQLRTLLTAAGCSIVAEAASGDQLLALYEQHRPDLVTLDITMPGRDGAQVAAELLARHREANVVVCTSSAMRDKVESCRRAGVRHYLTKPLEREQAVSVFRRALGAQTVELPRLDAQPGPEPSEPR